MKTRLLPFVLTRYSTMVFGLVGLLLAGSFIPPSGARALVMSALASLLPLAALYGLGHEPRRQRRASALSLVFVGCVWASFTVDTDAWRTAASASACLLMTYLALAILDEVLRSERITVDTLYGAVGVYFLIGLAFAAVYEIIELWVPQSFSGALTENSALEHLVYFSFVTLATLGYGDIAPVSSPARTLAILEAIAGIVYTTVLLARLVALHASAPKVEPEREDRP